MLPPESSSERSTSSGTRSVLRAGLRKSAWRSFFDSSRSQRSRTQARPGKPLSVGEMIVAQEDPLVAALHGRPLRGGRPDHASRRQRAAERYY
jgi:hypothetical protein